MAKYKLIVAGNEIKDEFFQNKAPVVFIQELFKENNFDELKKRIFEYAKKAFKEDEKGTVHYNNQTFNLSKQCWSGEYFWAFRIIACYNIAAIKENISAINYYEDFEQYKNKQFDIITQKQPDSEHLKKEKAVYIIRKYLTKDGEQRIISASKLTKSDKDTSVSKKSGSKEKKSSTDNEKLREEIKDARAQMAFCDEAIVSTSNIVNVLAGENGFFPSEEMRKILTERYEKMRKNYLKTDWTDSDWTQEDPRSNKKNLVIVQQNRDYDAALLQVPGEYCYQSGTGTGDWKEPLFRKYNNIGHDMPVWLYYKNDPQNRLLSQRPRVMIVSKDPLRSEYDINDMLLLSTPWAHHSLKFLENPDPARLKALKIIHGFLKKGAIVYLTDVHKLYWTLHGKDLDELKDLKKNESDQNKRIVLEQQICDFKMMIQEIKQSRKKYLDEEITLFQPDIIISLGDQAADVLTGSWSKHKDTVYQNRIYVKYHPGAYLSDNPRGNDPTYWLRTGNGENDSFII